MLNFKQFLHKTECHTFVNIEFHLTKNILTSVTTKIINGELRGSSFQNIFFRLLWKVFHYLYELLRWQRNTEKKDITKNPQNKTK